VKALQRRAASNDAINSWTSLSAAVEGIFTVHRRYPSFDCLLIDYTALLKLLPSSSPLFRETERSLQLLKPRTEDAQKRETAEMLDKLKGLGNSLLGTLPDPLIILIFNFLFQGILVYRRTILSLSLMGRVVTR
jgi:hypothetical protein